MNPSASPSSLWSVRALLNWLALACLLPGALGAAMLFIYQYHEGRDQQEKDMIQMTRALVQAVDSHLLRGQALALALSTADSLQRHDLASFHERARQTVMAAGLGSNVVLRDRQGRQLLNTSVRFGTPLPTQNNLEHVRSVFTTGKPSVSNLFYGPVLKRAIISVDVPVIIDGTVVYALGVGILPEQFNALLRTQGLPADWVAAVFDTNGTIVGRNRSPEKYVGHKARSILLKAMMKSSEGTILAISQEGVPVLSFFSRSPVTHWRVAVGIPRQTVQAGIVQRLSMLGAGVIALFGIALLLAWFIGGRIAHSVKALTIPAMALSSGQLIPVPRVYIKEAIEVASAIDRAGILLQERASTLEIREAELVEAYRMAKFGTWHWNLQTGEVEASDSIREMYGRDVPAFLEQRGTLLTVESWEHVNAASQEVMRTRSGYDLELQINHGDGDTRWINSKCEAVCDEQDEVVALRGTVQDITERKRQDEALRQSEALAVQAARHVEAERRRLDAVLEATPVGIVVADAAGRVLQANPANRRLWGLGRSSSSSVKTYREWKGWWADGSERHGRPLLDHEWPMARALRGEESPRDIVEIESFDVPPVRRTVLISAAPIKDGEGKISGGVVAQMDITDRVMAEEALKQAGRRKDEFLAMLAHELRNPLAPISAAADLLGLDRLDPSRVKPTSAIIARQVKHMTGLIDDLLDISRVTRGLVTLAYQMLDVKHIVSDATEQAKPLLDARQHRINIQLPAEAAFVLGDQKRLVQVVTNLLNNAAKFTPDGGQVVLQVVIAGKQIELTVSDNGIGMTSDMTRRAFELFAQGERTPDRSQGGLGIGLALVKSLVELHEGSVAAFSEGTGKGSRFTICLPLVTAQAQASVSQQGPVHISPTPTPLRVMIVDDNEDAATMLAMFIEAIGHQVVVEHSSIKALERAHLEQPDVYLLDIGLPELDGKELARRLRGHPQTAKALLIAVTGYGKDDDRDKALAAGFDHYFVKPLDPAKLETVLLGVNKV